MDDNLKEHLEFVMERVDRALTDISDLYEQFEKTDGTLEDFHDEVQAIVAGISNDAEDLRDGRTLEMMRHQEL